MTTRTERLNRLRNDGVANVYTAGPMTGIADFNRPAFIAAVDQLRRDGFAVISPIDNFSGQTDLPYEAYMRAALHHLLQVDAVVVLDGWDKSEGARFEAAVAFMLGLPVIDMEMEPINENKKQ